MPRLEDFLTLAQAAERAGLRYQTACLYRQRGTWPAPDRTILGRNVWHVDTIDKWVADRKRAKAATET